MLAATDLSYTYDGQSVISFPDFQVGSGETLLVLGESGKGKTTLLHLLGGIIISQTGDIDLDGTKIGQLKGQKLDAFRAKNIGIIFQEAHFIRSLNVTENLLFVQKLAGLIPNRDFVHELLNRVGLSDKKFQKTSSLSQGEKQRLNILRAIITKPGVILADEPTSALDDTNCSRVMDMLKNLVEEVNAALIIVTHDNRLKDRFFNKIELS